MPIKFRCPHCRQFLGIARSKAGEVTDCPTCGMSIRVPTLEGKVEPLPAPALNLQDTGLADALDQLAQLAAAPVATGPPETVDDPERRETPSVVKHGPLSPATVIPLDPVIVSVETTPQSLRTSAVETAQPAPSSPAGSVDTQVDDRSALAELAEQPLVPRQPNPAVARTYSRKRLSLWVGAATAGLSLFALGYLCGRAGNAPQARQATEVPQPEVDSPAVADVALARHTVALEGRVTYVTPDGGTKSDAGARVIVLPSERAGTIPLAEAGFQPGAGPVDTAVASASLRALGRRSGHGRRRGSLPGEPACGRRLRGVVAVATPGQARRCADR